MTKAFLIFFILFAVNGAAQKQAISFSAGHVLDKDWNSLTGNISLAGPIPILDNRYSAFLMGAYSYNFSNAISAVVGCKALVRRINYSTPYAVIGGFYHNTVEVPIFLRYTKPINNFFKISFDLGAGGNFVISPDWASEKYVDYEVNSKFKIISERRVAYFTCVGLNLESKLANNNFLMFSMGYNLQLNPLFKFEASNNLLTLQSNSIKPSYLYLGIGFKRVLKKAIE